MENILKLKEKALGLLRKKKYEEAYPLLVEIVEKDPRDVVFRDILLGICSVLEKYGEGLKAAEKAVELFPEKGDFYYYKGYFMLTLETAERVVEMGELKIYRKPSLNPERLEECVKMFEKAIEKGTTFLGEAWKLKGDAFLHLKRWEEAIEAYDRAAEEYGEESEILYNKGKALVRLERWEEAAEAMDKVLKEEPDAAAFFYKGLALFHLKRYEDALTAFGEVIKLAPHFHEVYFYRWLILESLGRNEEAKKEYEKYLGDSEIVGVEREVEFNGDYMDILDDMLSDLES